MQPQGLDSELHLLDVLTLRHFEEMEQLEHACYADEFIAPAAEAYAWYLHAPDTTIALVDAGGHVAGFINMFPVSSRVYECLLAGTFNDAELTTVDVVAPSRLQPGQDSPLHMFLSCIVVDRAHRGGAVSHRLLSKAVERYAGVEHLVDGIVTDNVTPEGERFSRRWGFAHVCASDHGSQIYAQPYEAFAQRVRAAGR